jgi:dephospho-CoA kinase
LRYSAVLADWQIQASERKGQLQEVGWLVMAGGLQAELNRRLVVQISAERDVAVDGLRHPLDRETLCDKYFPSFHLLFIDSPPRLRFDRLNRRGRYADFASFLSADSHPVEQQINSLRIGTSLVIPNEGSLQELYKVIDGVISRFRKEGRT